MQAQRRAKLEPNLRIPFGQIMPVLLEVFDDVRPGGEEVGEELDRGRARFHTALASARNVGLSQFQIGDFDDTVQAFRTEHLGQAHQIVIGLGTPAAMRDEQNGGGHGMLTSGDNGQGDKILAGGDRRFLCFRRQNHVHEEIQELPQ